jgi:Na+-transporting NADH:ubiquinone oxidoreductase subunit NqrE
MADGEGTKGFFLGLLGLVGIILALSTCIYSVFGAAAFGIDFSHRFDVSLIYIWGSPFFFLLAFLIVGGAEEMIASRWPRRQSRRPCVWKTQTTIAILGNEAYPKLSLKKYSPTAAR